MFPLMGPVVAGAGVTGHQMGFVSLQMPLNYDSSRRKPRRHSDTIREDARFPEGVLSL